MDNRPIGVFDSGIGGLAAVRTLRRLLPGESILYVGDTARMPYGDRTAAEINRLTDEVTGWLLRRNVKALIAACGTISCNAAELLHRLPVPCFDVVSAAADAAAAVTKNGRVGVAATAATVQSGRFAAEIQKRTGQAVTAVACPRLAPMVESGMTPDDPALAEAAAEYCLPFLQNGTDTVVLGCTHYPLAANAFARVLGEGVVLIDCAAEAAKAAAAALAEAQLLREDRLPPAEEYCFTALPPEAAQQTACRLLGERFIPRLLPPEALTEPTD